jgi:hypothetical protein
MKSCLKVQSLYIAYRHREVRIIIIIMITLRFAVCRDAYARKSVLFYKTEFYIYSGTCQNLAAIVATSERGTRSVN